MLNWGVQRGTVVIPGAHSEDPKHVEYLTQNKNIFDFKIDHEDMEDMNKLDYHHRLFSMHAGFVDFCGYDIFA